MDINFFKNPLFEDLKITNDSMKLCFLGKAIDESVNLINCGLNYFRKINFTNNDLLYSLSFLHLSRGFELLMKCMICYKKYDNTKDDKRYEKHFPSKEEMKSYRHNLNRLREEIRKNYQGLFRGKTSNPKMISQLKEDRDFISKDKKLIRILKIISEYGNKGRYYELDYVTSDNKKNNISPKSEMQRLIIELLEKDEQLCKTYINNGNDLLISNKVWQEIIGKYFLPYLIQFCRALRHQFLYGVLGVEAKRRRSVCSQKFNLLD